MNSFSVPKQWRSVVNILNPEFDTQAQPPCCHDKQRQLDRQGTAQSCPLLWCVLWWASCSTHAYHRTWKLNDDHIRLLQLTDDVNKLFLKDLGCMVLLVWPLRSSEVWSIKWKPNYAFLYIRITNQVCISHSFQDIGQKHVKWPFKVKGHICKSKPNMTVYRCYNDRWLTWTFL